MAVPKIAQPYMNTDRPDGRIEIIKGGLVVWSGTDAEAAQAMFLALLKDTESYVSTRREVADKALPRAIDRLRG